MRELLTRMEADHDGTVTTERICRGPFLSRGQYLVDVDQWGYPDARLRANGGAMTLPEIRNWTAGIARDGS